MRLVCRYCMHEHQGSERGYQAALRAAAVISDPPARITTSWLCPDCGKMNRQGKPEQGQLFASQSAR